jgi:hypothetical protein
VTQGVVRPAKLRKRSTSADHLRICLFTAISPASILIIASLVPADFLIESTLQLNLPAIACVTRAPSICDPIELGLTQLFPPMIVGVVKI